MNTLAPAFMKHWLIAMKPDDVQGFIIAGLAWLKIAETI